MKTTVLFLGSTDFSVEILKLLTASPLYEVTAVITAKDRPRSRRGLREEPTPVKTFCLKQGLPVTSSLKESEIAGADDTNGADASAGTASAADTSAVDLRAAEKSPSGGANAEAPALASGNRPAFAGTDFRQTDFRQIDFSGADLSGPVPANGRDSKGENEAGGKSREPSSRPRDLERTAARTQAPAPFPARLAVTAGYGRILPASFLKAFPEGAVNIHPSLLPQWRGAAPVERSLMAGDKKTGVSLQIMAESVDAGDIIRQYEFPTEEEDTAREIYEKALKVSKILLFQDLPLFIKGEIQAKPQKGPPSFAPKILKQEGKILWKEPARRLHNKIRALCQSSGAFTFLKNGERLKIFRSRILPENPEFFENWTRLSSFAKDAAGKGGDETNKSVLKAGGSPAPGSLFLSENKRRLAAAAGKGFLELLILQKAGGKKLAAEDFVRGAAPLLKDAGLTGNVSVSKRPSGLFAADPKRSSVRKKPSETRRQNLRRRFFRPGFFWLLFFVFFAACVYALPRLLASNLKGGEDSPWIGLLYTYGLGALVFAAGLFRLRRNSLRRGNRRWFAALSFGLLWGFALHSLWIYLALSLPYKGG